MSLTFTTLPVKDTPCPYFINDGIPAASCLRTYQSWEYVYYTSSVCEMSDLLFCQCSSLSPNAKADISHQPQHFSSLSPNRSPQIFVRLL